MKLSVNPIAIERKINNLTPVIEVTEENNPLSQQLSATKNNNLLVDSMLSPIHGMNQSGFLNVQDSEIRQSESSNSARSSINLSQNQHSS